MKNLWRFLRKLKTVLPYDSAIPYIPGIYSEKTIIWKDICTPMFIAVLFTIARMWKQPKCPWTEEWIKKKKCIYVCVRACMCMRACAYSVMSNSLWPHGLQPPKPLCPWNSLGKNTGVGYLSFSRESSWPRDWTHVSCVSCIGKRILYHCANHIYIHIYMHTHNGIALSHKKNEIMPFAATCAWTQRLSYWVK